IQRCLTEHMNADVQPVGPGSEGAGVEPEAEPGGLARLGTLPQPHENSGAGYGQRPPLERRKTACEQRAGGQRDQAPCSHSGQDSLRGSRASSGTKSRGGTTRSASIRRRSARATRNSKPSILAPSPRRGNRPSSFIRSPATVSKPSSSDS